MDDGYRYLTNQSTEGLTYWPKYDVQHDCVVLVRLTSKYVLLPYSACAALVYRSVGYSALPLVWSVMAWQSAVIPHCMTAAASVGKHLQQPQPPEFITRPPAQPLAIALT